jgi:signal transduction histidine kinase
MKPALVWTAFAACLAVVLAAMAWNTATVLRLERAEAEASAQAAMEENIRLALWRMDSMLTSLLARESARPYFHYGSFYAPEAPYTRMLAGTAAAPGLVASPLLREAPDSVLIHFQRAPGGALTSPQAPSGPLAARAVAEGHTTGPELAERRARLDDLRARLSAPDALLARLPPQPQAPPAREETAPPDPARNPLADEAPPREAKLAQQYKNVKEFEARQQSVDLNRLGSAGSDPAAGGSGTGQVEAGAMSAFWSGPALILARRVHIDGALYVQGCWLDWPRLQRELQASVADLLPSARLEPIDGTEGGSTGARSRGPVVYGSVAADDERRLAALPLRLLPGRGLEPPAPVLSPTRLTLVGAWAGLLVAAASVAALLGGVLALSERRRVFVSAVTHELRTPLTTFRLYTDMLAEGMVPAEEKRREYLGRLRAEAERLGHLVENVLFYSRLEGGRSGGARSLVDLAETLASMRPALGGRAERSGLQLSLTNTAGGPVRVLVDVSALEQVAQNLVDNACKYAAASEPPLIELAVGREGSRAFVHVRDHGPGLTKAERRRLFRPFSKSDHEAAAKGPGVGLGLALSRRLMRAQGGDLAHDPAVTRGARFVVTLPLARS